MKAMDVKKITKIAMCVALLCVSSYLVIPLPFTPAMITAQTLIVNLIALILSPLEGFSALGIYLLLGLCGVPVFAGATSGLAKLFGPTGGFLFGFLIAVPIISLLKGKTNKMSRYCLVTIAVGMPIIYIFGIVFMALVGHMSLQAALMAAVVPFIPGDIAKCVVASILGVALNKALAKQFQA